MRRAAVLVAVLVAVVVGLATGWAAVVAWTEPAREVAWIEQLYTSKEGRARAMASPKIVLVGGSGTHFGYSARLVSQRTGWHAVNLGTHGALGLNYILDRAKRSLSRGDVVVLSVEYPALSRYIRPSSTLASFVLHFDRRYLARAPWLDTLCMIWGVSPFELAQQRLTLMLPWLGALYRRGTTDEFGDETTNLAANVTASMRAQVAAWPLIVRFDYGADPPVLKSFSAWAVRRDIRVFFAWCPLNRRAEYVSGRYDGYFDRIGALMRHAGFEVVGGYSDFLLPLDAMLDTQYHANQVGTKLLSERLSALLCERLKCVASP